MGSYALASSINRGATPLRGTSVHAIKQRDNMTKYVLIFVLGIVQGLLLADSGHLQVIAQVIANKLRGSNARTVSNRGRKPSSVSSKLRPSPSK